MKEEDLLKEDAIGSLDDLKLKKEILLLNKNIDDHIEKTPTSWLGKKIALIHHKLQYINTSFLFFGGLIAAFFSIYNPVTELIKKNTEAQKITFDDKFRSILKDYQETTDNVHRARQLYIMMSYDYSTVIPFFLNELKIPDNDYNLIENAFITKIDQETLLGNTADIKGIHSMILKEASNVFKKGLNDFNDKKNVPQNEQSTENYIRLIMNLDLDGNPDFKTLLNQECDSINNNCTSDIKSYFTCSKFIDNSKWCSKCDSLK